MRPPPSRFCVNPDGAILAEHVLADPPGHRVAAKSVSFDPLWREIWVPPN